MPWRADLPGVFSDRALLERRETGLR